MRANVLQEILIDGQSAGPGSPSVDITDIHGKFFKVIQCKERILLTQRNKKKEHNRRRE